MKYTSTTITTASGSMAGVTFSRNRYGQYTRRRATPVNPGTLPQTTARIAFANASIGWSALTAAQMAAWAAFAAATPKTDSLGNVVYLTGHQWYVGYTAFRAAAGVAPVAAAPTTPGQGAAPDIGVVALTAGTGMTLAAGNWVDFNFGDGVNDILAAWISEPLSPGIAFYKGPFTRSLTPSIGLIAGLALPGDPIPIAPVTALVPGQLRAVQLRQLIDDGTNLKLSGTKISGIITVA